MATHKAMTTETRNGKRTTYAPCGEARVVEVKGGDLVTKGPAMVPAGKAPSCEKCRNWATYEASL